MIQASSLRELAAPKVASFLATFRLLIVSDGLIESREMGKVGDRKVGGGGEPMLLKVGHLGDFGQYGAFEKAP
jgi:hypothetical protein